MSYAIRETFASPFGRLATMIGVAVGLGNVWRFPYMAGQFGGASFVLFYVLVVLLIGVPALMCEWALGRSTRRGPVGAFERARFPAGRMVGWFFFAIVVAAMAYYSNAVGWVLYYAVGELAALLRLPWAEGAVLPPATGLDGCSLALQLGCTLVVLTGCVLVVRRGLRDGIEVASKVLMPILLVSLLVLIGRGLTLPGAGAGVEWYLLKFDPAALRPGVMLAALGQAIFSLSLGGTMMVVYGSYLDDGDDIGKAALATSLGDLGAGLLAGLAILPAVFALGLKPDSGPGLLFNTLPQVFDQLPAGQFFGLVFFCSLGGAAFLSNIAAFEVLVAGITDSTGRSRRKVVVWLAGLVFLLAIPPMINLEIFVPWDLTFGSGMQTLGALCAVLAVGWTAERARMLHQLGGGRRAWLLYVWLRFVVPAAVLAVGFWWLWSEVL